QESSIVFYDSFQTYVAGLPDSYTFTQFGKDYAAATFEDFTQSVAQIVTQSFGTIAGSRVRFQDAFYRVRTTNVSQNEISFSADFDTLFTDFAEEFSEYTFGSWVGLFELLTFTDFAFDRSLSVLLTGFINCKTKKKQISAPNVAPAKSIPL
ncbi:MAG: hypothetical protein R6T98_08385, partial [Desulfatiglandales bacterium]